MSLRLEASHEAGACREPATPVWTQTVASVFSRAEFKPPELKVKNSWIGLIIFEVSALFSWFFRRFLCVMAILRTQTASFDPTLIFGNSFFFHSKWKLSMFITLSRFAKNLRKKLLILECFRFVFFFFFFCGAHVTRLHWALKWQKLSKNTAVMMSSGVRHHRI